MTMLSDILILFAKPLDDLAVNTAKSTLMACGRSVLVHQKEGQDRLFLVRFDPRDVTPASLLSSIQDAGFDAKMAGG